MMDLGDEKFKEDLDKILEDTEYEIIHNADKQQEVMHLLLLYQTEQLELFLREVAR